MICFLLRKFLICLYFSILADCHDIPLAYILLSLLKCILPLFMSCALFPLFQKKNVTVCTATGNISSSSLLLVG